MNPKNKTMQDSWTRYRSESHYLAALSAYALNKPKNRIKQDFEDMPLSKIFDLLLLEIEELRKELVTHTEVQNFEKITSELADCAAFLTGMLARLSKESETAA